MSPNIRARACAAVLMGILTAGCASIPPSPLTFDAAKTLRLESVNVTMAPDATVSWANAENDYVAARRAKGDLPKKKINEVAATGPGDTRAVDDAIHTEIVQSPEGQSYLKDRVTGRLTDALTTHVKTQLQNGNKPVKLDVTVHTFIVPSAVQRVVIGGAPVIAASAVLRDASSGAVIAERQNMISAAMAGNGWGGVLADQLFDDLDVRLVNSYAQQYRDWLIPKG